MRYARTSRGLLLWTLLYPLALQPQMPPVPGKLLISSEPAGATVTINGTKMSQLTNATFVVSPGDYTVAVSSADRQLNCPGKLFHVASNSLVSHKCSTAGWE
jgi:PEGA domain